MPELKGQIRRGSLKSRVFLTRWKLEPDVSDPLPPLSPLFQFTFISRALPPPIIAPPSWTTRKPEKEKCRRRGRVCIRRKLPSFLPDSHIRWNGGKMDCSHKKREINFCRPFDFFPLYFLSIDISRQVYVRVLYSKLPKFRMRFVE